MTDKKLTDNEIIKALEGAILNAKGCDSKVWSIEIYKLENALDLITRQQAEIDRLNKEIQITKDAYTMLQTKIEIIKAEAVKEFVERLNEGAQIADCFDSYNMVVGTHFIDNLLKEMVDEEE